MRRPVKPFVTEYRGAMRRQGPGGSAPKPDFSAFDKGQFDLEQPAIEPRAEPRPALSARHAEAQEDSYEAAMRAADALFAARQPAPAATRPAPSDAPGADGLPAEASHAGGRVLRVLDEAPSPELLRLEAEHAPKRRGRKPGSKNKPKVAPIVTQAALEVATAAGARDVGVRDVEDWDIEDWDDDGAAASVGVAPGNGHAPRATPVRAVALDAARAAATEGPRTGDKYAWVRTKLKPGQQWKRRLPKVAW